MAPDTAADTAATLAGDAPHVVYRISDGADVIYVGCTNNLKRRLAEHRRRAEWWPLAKTCTSQGYPSRSDALVAERALIRDLSPAGNSVCYEAITPAERDMEQDAEISAAMFGLIFGGLTE